MTSSNRDNWESSYRSGDFEHWEFNFPSPELVAVVATNILQPRGKVLDVGCGGGLDAIFLAQCGFRVIGVDFCETALRIAQKRAARARVEVSLGCADAFALPLDNASMDFVNDRGVFHIIRDRDRGKYASELFRVLKTDGKLLIRGSTDRERFYPVTEGAIDKYFPSPKFQRGPVLPIPLLSVVGAMQARIAFLTKIQRAAPNQKKQSRARIGRQK